MVKERSPPSVFDTEFMDTLQTLAPCLTPADQNGPSSVNGRITSSCPTKTRPFVSCSMFMDTVLTPTLVTENTPVLCVVMSNMLHPTAPGTDTSSYLYKIVTPYNLHTWGIALHNAILLYTFPTLSVI